MTTTHDIQGVCLCGAISFRHRAAETLVSCNCEACRRYRTLWAHGDLPDIEIREDGPAIRFARTDGDGDLYFVSCAACGVTTHWESVDPKSTRRAVNAALCPPDQIKDMRLRHFDGADSWTFLD
ncbi:MAG: GFA family protein [Pseudomonadota bacterium]